MLYTRCGSDPAAWAAEQFGSARLGHKSRTRRVTTIAEALARSPGLSIPNLFTRPYDVQATYDFFSRPEATPDNIQSAHRHKVLKAMNSVDRTTQDILLIGDLTTASWDRWQNIEGLGPVGDGKSRRKGFTIHSVLAARVVRPASEPGSRPQLELLGLADQQFSVRPVDKPRANGETKKERRSRWRESLLWQQSVRRIGPRDEARARWIHVNDREADIYGHMQECLGMDHSFIIRAKQNRHVLQEVPAKLFDGPQHYCRHLGSFELEVERRPPSQPGGTARLNVWSGRVELKPPRGTGRKLAPIAATVIWVEESGKSAAGRGAKEPLRWVLLSDLGAESFEEAMTLVGYYVARWIIEEFHRVLKESMKLEELQLETGQRLIAAASVMSVVALRVVDLREHVRIAGAEPAEKSGLGDEELQVLELVLKKKFETVEEVSYAVARLGGHLRHNGRPGCRSLLRGLLKLQDLTEGYLLAVKAQQRQSDP